MAISLGGIWPWDWRRHYDVGTLTGYTESSFGRWQARRGPSDSAWVTQIGLTPVLRLHPSSWRPGWFVEAGIGANLLAPVYQSRGKRFSTVFNFGDHVAVGVRFGAFLEHEVSLRLQHFSNAGIKQPNPGEDFIQLRYSWDLW